MAAKIITTDSGYKYIRRSNWIHLDNIVISPRNSHYNCDNDGNVYIFRHDNRRYYLDDFMRLTVPEIFTNEYGKSSFLSGYDCTNYYNPYLIEIHPDGEYIRLYQSINENF